MPPRKRLTKADMERIKAEVRASILNPPTIYELYVRCECGHWQHEERRTCLDQPEVTLLCERCRWDMMASGKTAGSQSAA